jgi:hypothetical protein
MKPVLKKREQIAVMMIQAIICKREAFHPSPKHAARRAVEHADCLIEELRRRDDGIEYLHGRGRRGQKK